MHGEPDEAAAARVPQLTAIARNGMHPGFRPVSPDELDKSMSLELAIIPVDCGAEAGPNTGSGRK
jgi:hypothetical protein